MSRLCIVITGRLSLIVECQRYRIATPQRSFLAGFSLQSTLLVSYGLVCLCKLRQPPIWRLIFKVAFQKICYLYHVRNVDLVTVCTSLLCFIFSKYYCQTTAAESLSERKYYAICLWLRHSGWSLCASRWLHSLETEPLCFLIFFMKMVMCRPVHCTTYVVPHASVATAKRQKQAH